MINLFLPNDETLRVTLLVLPESSMMSLASALDTMRAANRLANRSLFEWQIATLNAVPAALTCGLKVAPDITLDVTSSGDVFIVIASFNQQQHAGPVHLKMISRIAKNFALVGGIEAGSWILARAGLLERKAATTHREDLEEFGRHFPGIKLKPDRFVIDGSVFTTGGASPTFDFMLYLIGKRFGHPLAMEVASVFIYDNSKSAAETQPLVPLSLLKNYEPRVAAAIQVMEQHIDDTLNVKQIALQMELSVRTLELLFQQTLKRSPAAYYRHLRLQVARRLVIDTRLNLQEIAIRTGFNSLAAFSRRFRQHYHQTPSECRRQAQTTG